MVEGPAGLQRQLWNYRHYFGAFYRHSHLIQLKKMATLASCLLCNTHRIGGTKHISNDMIKIRFLIAIEYPDEETVFFLPLARQQAKCVRV